MKLKDKNDVNRMIGRRIWCIYPTYESGNPKEYLAEKSEYLILGTSKMDGKKILLYDVEEERIEERRLSDVRCHLNRCGVVTRLYHVDYAWAFTEGRVEKCFLGLLESIEANHRRCEKYKRIKEYRYAFSLSQLEGKGLENLEGEGIEATDKTKWNDPKECVFRLPDNYGEAFTAKAIRDLGILGEIADGKKAFRGYRGGHRERAAKREDGLRQRHFHPNRGQRRLEQEGNARRKGERRAGEIRRNEGLLQAHRQQLRLDQQVREILRQLQIGKGGRGKEMNEQLNLFAQSKQEYKIDNQTK